MSESQTVISADGKILLFGLEDFIEHIANGNCCFICGAKPKSKEFNDEHIIPSWILKRFKLYSKQIQLPNDTFINYSKYKVPCCKECNSDLGSIYEEPISELLCKPYIEIVEEIKQNPAILRLMFKWLALIFLKIHLKDNTLLAERDLRKKSDFIGKAHYWEDIHHIHCVSRSHYTNAVIDDNVFGSIFIFQSLLPDYFDYIDNSNSKTVLLKLGDFCIISVLNDSCAGSTMIAKNLEKINGPLNSFQMREIVAHLSYININLKERPMFHSNFTIKGTYKICAAVPEFVSLVDEKKRIESPGKYLMSLVKRVVEDIEDIENKEQYLKEIEDGKRAFLFNDKGKFIDLSKSDEPS